MNTSTKSLSIPGLTLVLLLAVWSFLSLFHLGTPSFFWEELLVSLTARYPVAYIYHWSSSVETHPPLFHLLVKLFLFFGKNEFVLRLPSVLFGAGCIVATYFVTKGLTSPRVAILSTALLAINPTFLEWSRKERPYPLFLFIFLLSLGALIKYIRTFDKKYLLALLASNLLLVWTHYIAYIIFLSQGIIISACLYKNFARKHLASFLWYIAGMAAVVLSNFNMLYATVLKHDYFETGKLSAYDTFTRHAASLLDLVTYFDVKPVIPPALAIIGLALLAKRFRTAFWTVLVFVAVPIAALAILRANWFGANYLLFMTPLLTMAMATACSPLLRKDSLACLAAVLLASASAASIFTRHFEKYYDANSYDFALNRQRDYAAMVNGIPGKPQFVFCSQPLRNAVGWYLDLLSNDSLVSPAVAAGSAPRNIAFVLNDAACVNYSASDAELISRMGTPTNFVDGRDIRIYQWQKDKSPPARLAPSRIIELPSVPEVFYPTVREMEKVNIDMDWGGRLIPTENDVDSFFTYEFENAAGNAGGEITVDMDYHNRGKGNVLKLSFQFDDEPYQDAFVVSEPSDERHRQVKIQRRLPFKRLLLKTTMNCAKETPEYPGCNLASLGVSKLAVGFDASGPKTSPLKFDVVDPGRVSGDYLARGFGSLGLNAGKYYRWGLGPESSLSFFLPADATVRASLDCINFIPGQEVAIVANGNPLVTLRFPTYGSLDANPGTTTFAFAGRKGLNTVALRYKFWNMNKLLGKPARYLEGIDAPVALHITGLNLTIEDPGRDTPPQ